MLGLSIASNLSKQDFGYQVISRERIPSLVAHYKLGVGAFVDSNGDIERLTDVSSNTSEDMDMLPPAADNDVAYDAATGKLEFRTPEKSFLQTAADKQDLGKLTIFCVADIVESGANNEAVFGGVGGHEFRLYRGLSSTQARFRANSVNTDITLSSSIPTGKFQFCLVREADGNVLIRVGGSERGNASSSLSDTFEFRRIGNGSTDCDIFELIVFNDTLSTADIEAIEFDIKQRHGL